GHLDQGHGGIHRSAVAEDVDGTQLLLDLSDHCLHVGFLGNVAAHRQGDAAFGTDLFRCLVDRARYPAGRRGARDDGDPCAFPREALCNRLADAPAATGDDGDLAVKLAHDAVLTGSRWEIRSGWSGTYQRPPASAAGRTTCAKKGSPTAL